MATKDSLIRGLTGALAILSFAVVSNAGAQTNLMPDRDALLGVPIVVWGNTTHPGGTAYSIDFGDGSPVANGIVNANSQSYIAITHTYVSAAPHTATLTVGAAVASATITVINGASLTTEQLEDAQINNAIEDGLRYQYFSVDAREARHDSGWPLAVWAGHGAFTSMATLAFENHGHTIASGDIYSPVVQGGLNYVFSGLVTQALAVEPAGDPCVGGIPNPCAGLRPVNAGAIGYSTSIVLLAIVGSGAPGAVVAPGLGATAGQPYSEVAQRLVNTIAWGQADPGTGGRGGWQYGLDNGASDGSAIGWNVLGLLDAAAFGATIPAFVGPELEHEIAQTTNATGSMGYTTATFIPNTAKTGVRLQALSFIGVPLGGTSSIGTVTPQASVDYIDVGFNLAGSCVWGSGHPFGSPNLVNGKNCIYSTFNVFKGLKLYGVTTLPSVTRPDKDWHKDYQTFLASIQTSPTTTTGGSFGALEALSFGAQGDTALALLVLSPVALILPDPVRFSEIGLTPLTATNPVGTDHTVTAEALSVAGAPVPGATVDFEVLTGPNAGLSGSDVTDANGLAAFTYTDTGGPGTDTIQASIGNLNSNIVEKIWQVEQAAMCDADGDEDIDINDIRAIMAARGQQAEPDDPRDANGNGVIGIDDGRLCVLQCTLPRCAVPPQ